MAEAKARRGRPKGSGIDDSERLRTIAELMLANPALKPTTAIKSLGITDPSAIRRLRDKFQDSRAELMAGSTSQTRAATASDGATAVRSADPPRPAVIKPARSSIPSCAGPAVHVQAAHKAPDSKAWVALWYGLGLRAMGAAIEAQLSLIQQAMRMPPVAAAMRHQLAVGQLAMTLCLPQTPRRVLH